MGKQENTDFAHSSLGKFQMLGKSLPAFSREKYKVFLGGGKGKFNADCVLPSEQPGDK